ncbi:hypothetical protein [Faecalitalea cylindroides]|uniref:hypothetical protein n=1 Tax=Faecalitalea cylindroides TaxID=39483 RepID=UPI0039F61A13
MQGEVYVQYTPIGGMNMSRIASDPNLTGSSGHFDQGGAPIGTHVSWTLPGGINGHQNWGYLTGRDNGVVYDDSVEELIVGMDDMQATQYINNLVYDYVHDILVNDDNLPEGYDWGAFKNYFTGCIMIDGEPV